MNEARNALTAAGTIGLVDGLARPANYDRVRQAVIDGHLSFDEAVRAIVAAAMPRPTPPHPAQRVLDQLDSFQAAIEAKLSALEQSPLTLPAAATTPAGAGQPIGQLLPWLVLTAFVASVTTLVVAQLIR